MSVIYVVLPLALLISTIAVIAFVWSVKRGQLDDLETPAIRMLFDDAGALRAKPGDEPPEPDPTSGELGGSGRK